MITMTARGSIGRAPGLARAVSVARRRETGISLALVMPLVAFIVMTFVVPVGILLFRSADNPLIANTFPTVLERVEGWSERDGAPPEAVFDALQGDIARAIETGTLGAAVARLNQDYAGARSLLAATARQLKSGQITGPPWRDAILATDPRWSDPTLWTAIKQAGQRYTLGYFLHALDLERDPDGAIVARPAEQSIHLTLFARTFWVGLAISALCVVLGFPVAYLMARLTESRANLLMILVLLPFWTSVLVRIASWIVLLQREGLINQVLVAAGIVATDGRPVLVYNMTGTLIVGVYIMLPFMVLPLYSVMRTIPPRLVQAAVSLGAHPFTAFWKVYVPLTIPGISAGSSLVFILAVGYYITPALVGGQSGQLISNIIAYHMQQSLNWGLAAALSTLLLVAISVLYLSYTALMRGRR